VADVISIGQIAQVEGQQDKLGTGPLDRQRARWLQSRRPYEHLCKLARRVIRFRGLTPNNGLFKALRYAIEQLPHLEPCFLDGRIKFDNNLTENAIRPAKLGMKNWMFIGHEKTGWRSAVIYTFVEQVRRHGKDPFAYFEWVFDKLMHNPAEEELPDLLPAAWLKGHLDSVVMGFSWDEMEESVGFSVYAPTDRRATIYCSKRSR